jgi:hypothetical protein
MTQVIIPTRANCGPFIKAEVLSAKRALYRDMITHMSGMMSEMGNHVSKLTGLIKPSVLQDKLKAVMDPNYKETTEINEQAGIITFDNGINKLIEYLNILDDKYEQWIHCMCKDGGKWNPVKKDCCPVGHILDENGNCNEIGCKAGEVKVNGICICPPNRKVDAGGNCIECAENNYINEEGKCVECNPATSEIWTNPQGKRFCKPKCNPDEIRDENGNCVIEPIHEECPEPKVGRPPRCQCPTPKFDGEDPSGTCIKCKEGEKFSKGECKLIQKPLDPQVKADIVKHLVKVLDSCTDPKSSTYRYPPFTEDDMTMTAPYSNKSHRAITSINKFGTDIMSHESDNLSAILGDTSYKNRDLQYIYVTKIEKTGKKPIYENEFIQRIRLMYDSIWRYGRANPQQVETYHNKLFLLRQVFMILYKIASNYILILACDQPKLLSHYINSIYDLFNSNIINGVITPSTYDNRGVFDKLFNPVEDETEFNLRKGANDGVGNFLGGKLTDFFNHYASLDISYNTDNTYRTAYWNIIKSIEWNVLGSKISTTNGLENYSLLYYLEHKDALLERSVQQQSAKRHRRRGGARTDLSFGPDDIPQVLAQQVAWEEMNKQYNSLESEYQQMLPEPEPAPIHSLTEPIHRFIDDFADEDPLEEARESVGLLAPHEVDDLMANDNGIMDRIKPLYKNALPSAKDEWIPILVRADTLRTLL